MYIIGFGSSNQIQQQPVNNQTGGQGVGFQPIIGFSTNQEATPIPTPTSFNVFNLNNARAEFFLLIVFLILTLIFKNRIYRNISHLNNKQKTIWSIYFSVIFISLVFILLGGNLWKPFMNNDCDYYRFVQWNCIIQENITIALLLFIPSFILHKIWKDN